MAAPRKKSTAAWAFSDPILAEGQVGEDTTTGRRKIGDGVSAYSDLPFDDGRGGDLTRISTVADTAYTAVAADAGKLLKFTAATAVAFTIPPNASVDFPVGTVIRVLQYGAGEVTLTPGAAVTIRSGAGLDTLAQYSVCEVLKIGTNEWVASGSTEA